LNACAQRLNKAQSLGPNTREKAQIEELTSMLWARQDDPDKKARAAKIFARLLKTDGSNDSRTPPTRRVLLCKPFADLARAEPDKFLLDALAALGKNLTNPLSKADKKAVQSSYSGLILETVPQLTSGGSWAKLLPALRKGGENPWARACRAECLIEDYGPSLTGAALQEAQSQVGEWAKVEAAGRYARYVRGLFQAVTKKPARDVGRELALAFPGRVKESRLGATRHERVVEIWVTCSAAIRLTTASAEIPFATADAELVYHWLSTARQLTPTPGRDLRVSLALAAFARKTPDVKLGSELVRGLEKNPGLARLTRDAYPLLLGRILAQADTPAGRKVRLGDYETILRLFKEEVFPLGPQVRYQQVLRPAIRLAKQLRPAKGYQARLARLYSDLGELYRTNPGSFPKAYAKAISSLDQAIELDEQAEYYVNRAAARLGGPRPLAR
jgi:hypothetical protein